ncbi:hypothetical protein ABVC46_01545 [Lactobacillus crispatus]|jgi:hypothetical protein|uniref:Uncharacterized protein n=2 Tax=Lactobacillus crispatus TaxID=47770 RepID=A0AAW8WTV9_9LACO|nr:hypothetical protein [Lactobacillus crispatus]STX18436.1 DNA-directed RNA polymerase beta subunit [Lactobacillus acidophilus]MCT7731055.1 hypothetical protein [Lactobacillus crispatus]MCT7802162.1 hypothetical protein [Lactobacillus crispatus]MCT7807871.1 hypothetical protein [Lactobacillus crispatus]MCT7816398.1 hypothetical protein [Lactobacillus crispatus]
MSNRNIAASNFDQVVDDFLKNYQDRGMKKWAGFFLSDHTLKINKDKKKRSLIYLKKPEMNQVEISNVLLIAFSNHYQVSIQLKNIDSNDNFSADIVGFVQGYYAQSSILISDNVVELDEINHVELIK